LAPDLRGEQPVFGMMPGSAASRFSGAGDAEAQTTQQTGRIAQLEEQLQRLRLSYTDKHPEVQRVQRELEQLREQGDRAPVPEEPESQERAPGEGSLQTNPVYQNLRAALSEEQVRLADLRATLEQQEARVERLRERVNVIPEVEAELTRLNRDYNVVRQRYEAMLGRLEDLQTSQRVNTQSDRVEFRIIEPPYAPEEPAGPNRPLLATLVLVFALGAGGGTALAFDRVWPVYSTREGLQRDLEGVAVVGAIDLWLDDDGRARRRTRETAVVAGLLALVAAYAALAVFSGPIADASRFVAEFGF